MEQGEITTISEKGQVVIPQKIRKELKLTPKTKLVVYAKNDLIIMKAFKVPDLEKEWKKLSDTTDGKDLKVNEKGEFVKVGSGIARKIIV